MLHLDKTAGKIVYVLSLCLIAFCCNAQKQQQRNPVTVTIPLPVPKIKMQPRSQVWEFVSSNLVRRGIYDVILCRNGEGIEVRYNSHTWRKDIKFHKYYFLTKTRKGWKIEPVN